MTVQALNHINIRLPADELRALRDFYCDVLGLVDGARPPGVGEDADSRAVLGLDPAFGLRRGQLEGALDHPPRGHSL